MEKPDIDQRLSRLEATVEALARDVTSVAESVRKLSDAVRVQASTPWSTLAAWAGVILVVVSLGMSGYVREIGTLERKQEAHIELAGHPTAIQRTEGVTEKLELVDGNLKEDIADLKELLVQRILTIERHVGLK